MSCEERTMQNGVVLILLSVALTPVGDALSKDVGANMPPILVVFARYLVAGAIAGMLATIWRVPLAIPRDVRVPLILQSALVIGAMTMLIIALSKVPLALAVGGFLVAPIVAVVIATLAFGETLTPARAIGAMLSFLGALLILRPTGGLETGVLIAIGGGVLLGLFLALAGRNRLGLHPIVALMSQCLIGAAMLTPFALLHISEFDPSMVFHIAALGSLTASTHFLTVAAYQRSAAAVLAPFFYFNLVIALAIGFFWFNEVPKITALCGLSLIAFGGVLAVLPARRPRNRSRFSRLWAKPVTVGRRHLMPRPGPLGKR